MTKTYAVLPVGILLREGPPYHIGKVVIPRVNLKLIPCRYLSACHVSPFSDVFSQVLPTSCIAETCREFSGLFEIFNCLMFNM